MSQSGSLRIAAEQALSVEKQMSHPAQQLLHELQVHQIELEMQNEALRQSQTELEESRDRYLELYDLAPLAYLTLSDAGRISMVNLTGTTLLGVPRNKLMQKHFVQYVVPEDRDRWHRFFTQTLLDGDTDNFELSIQSADNKIFYAQLNCVRQKKEGVPIVMRITLTDVSRLRLAEVAMHEWHTFIQSTTWGIAIGNSSDQTIRLANLAYAQMHGYTVDELRNMPANRMYAPESRSRLTYHIEGLHKEGRITFDCMRQRKDGSTFPALVNMIIVAGINGKITKMVSVQDISPQKRLEDELKASQQSLRALAGRIEFAREEERKHIARELHDELGQILTALRMDVALISLRFGELDAGLLQKTQGMSALLNQAGRSLHEIVSNLRPTALDMGIVSAIRWLCHNFAAHTGKICVLHTTETKIDLDEAREISLFRIVQELLTNIARHAEAEHVDITLVHDAANIQMVVSDNGHGFDTTVVSKKSFGLLGIQERVIALGGQVKVVSAQNCGTLVKLTLPT